MKEVREGALSQDVEQKAGAREVLLHKQSFDGALGAWRHLAQPYAVEVEALQKRFHVAGFIDDLGREEYPCLGVGGVNLSHELAGQKPSRVFLFQNPTDEPH